MPWLLWVPSAIAAHKVRHTRMSDRPGVELRAWRLVRIGLSPPPQPATASLPASFIPLCPILPLVLHVYSMPHSISLQEASVLHSATLPSPMHVSVCLVPPFSVIHRRRCSARQQTVAAKQADDSCTLRAGTWASADASPPCIRGDHHIRGQAPSAQL